MRTRRPAMRQCEPARSPRGAARALLTAIAVAAALLATDAVPTSAAQVAAATPVATGAVLFRASSVVPTAAGRRTLDRLSAAVGPGEGPVTVTVVGYAVARRTTGAVVTLSRLRASYVARALRRRGLRTPLVRVTYRLRAGGLARVGGRAGQRAEVRITAPVAERTTTTTTSPVRPTTTTTTSVPPSSVRLACPGVRGRVCTTGTLRSSAPGSTTQASVTLNDGGALETTLFAEIEPPSIGCDEFSPSGTEELFFGLSGIVGNPDGFTKTVVLSEELTTELTADQFNVCFQAPHDFLALRPSEFEADAAAGDFSGNTTTTNDPVTEQTLYAGLVLPCSNPVVVALSAVPCVVSRQLVAVSNSPTCCRQRLTATVRTAAADPKLRF